MEERCTPKYVFLSLSLKSGRLAKSCRTEEKRETGSVVCLAFQSLRSKFQSQSQSQSQFSVDCCF
ncbi:hypothetical protein ACSBR2_033886 [Camellia fascicularis]